jgi:photolyase PhrII
VFGNAPRPGALGEVSSDAPFDRNLDALPLHARERVRVRVATPAQAGRSDRPFVLYWTRVAGRDHDNAALDAAQAAANALDRPLLVYQAIDERYPHASDRHHTFLLEGARDLAVALAARGVAHAVHVARPGHRGPHLRTLAERAALVVTEWVPVPPLDGWTDALADHCRRVGTPLWEVDASCIVPMTLVAARPERAYAFRTASRRIASAALAARPAEVRPTLPAPSLAAFELPFEPVAAATLDDRAIAALVAACAIDHGVGPVRETRGGMRAGYARWAAFLAHRLARYARDRNDALLDGTSRMSAYLHYGHVSALRLAREAGALLGDGADKFLDELLVWREVAWHWCAHTPASALHSLSALPTWAQQTLAAHEDGRRDPMPRARLDRASTGDALWDAAQRSLLVHGELHNNVRMTWGKAVAAWRPTAEDARETLVELNHRYALDGRDPASYGGLYWSLGLFDRPFHPPSPALGTLRPRPTAAHARRLDVTAYQAKIDRPSRRALHRVAVVGAGVAGLGCARALADHGLDVRVFDKGRAVGGRLSTRRLEGASFDLGAQYFTARDPRFARVVQQLAELGIVAPWSGRLVAIDGRGGPPTAVDREGPIVRWVGVPTMSAAARALAEGLDIALSTRVDALLPRALDDGRPGWELFGAAAPSGHTLPPSDARAPTAATSLGVFDAAVLTLPADQAVSLLASHAPSLVDAMKPATLSPCFALAVLDAPGGALDALGYDGVFVGRDEADPDGLALAWIARDGSKPGRSVREAFMLHARSAWSARWIDAAPDAVTAAMLAAVAEAFGGPVPTPRATHLHRWRYARALTPRAAGEDAVLADLERRLVVAGDWANGGRVEGAYLSGVAAAGRLLGLPEPPFAAPTDAGAGVSSSGG